MAPHSSERFPSLSSRAAVSAVLLALPGEEACAAKPHCQLLPCCLQILIPQAIYNQRELHHASSVNWSIRGALLSPASPRACRRDCQRLGLIVFSSLQQPAESNDPYMPLCPNELHLIPCPALSMEQQLSSFILEGLCRNHPSHYPCKSSLCF